MKVKFIDIKDFEKAFGEKATDFMRDRILSYNFSYNNLAASEKDKLVLSILKKIENPALKINLYFGRNLLNLSGFLPGRRADLVQLVPVQLVKINQF